MDGNFGPLGTNISYFVRGASSKRTLILIDGMPFNDPSGINQTYDLRLLDLEQVESIEILKGGLSTLYGTGAAAGVINISLKKAGNEVFSGNAKVGYGSFNTVNPAVSVNGTTGSFSYLFSGSYKKADGFSAADDQAGGGNFDDDGFEGYNFLGKIGYTFAENFTVGFTTSIDDFDTDFDGGAFADGDDFSEYHQVRMGISPKVKIGSGSLSGDFFYSKLDRLFNSPDFFDPTQRFINEYDAETLQSDVVLNQNLSSTIKFIGGLNYQSQSFSQPAVDETDFNMVDPYVTLIVDQSNLNVQIGGRLNNHSEYGSKLVYNINPSYLIPLQNDMDLKLMGSFSTSYITPSLFQLYGSFGNLELEAEESHSYEFGGSIYSSAVTVNVAYFNRMDDGLIDFRSLFDDDGNFIGGEYFNTTNDIRTSGIEFDAKVVLSSKVDLSANYTYLDTKDDVVLYRVPNHKYGSMLSYNPSGSTSIGVRHTHTGVRTQPFFNTSTFTTDDVETGAFDLIDLTASFQFEALTVSGAVNNFFDQEYTAIIGFNTVGRNYNLTVSYDF